MKKPINVLPPIFMGCVYHYSFFFAGFVYHYLAKGYFRHDFKAMWVTPSKMSQLCTMWMWIILANHTLLRSPENALK